MAILLTLLALLLVIAPAHADTVLLTDGSIQLGIIPGFGFEARFVASGPDLTVDATAHALDMTTQLPNCFLAGNLCFPGTVGRLGMDVFNAGVGEAVYKGVGFSLGDTAPLGPHNEWRVDTASIVLPPLGNPFTIVEPFTVGLDFGCSFLTEFCHQVIEVHAGGSGVATVTFAPSPFFSGEWIITSGVYEIQTPEPATWLLLASGIGLIAIVRWRRAH